MSSHARSNAKARRVPKQQRSVETVERILAAAAQLIADPSIDKVGTHLIAKAADVSVGAVYQFFPNIESIKLALIERSMDALFDRVVAILKNTRQRDVVASSDNLIDSLVAYYDTSPDTSKFMNAVRHTEEFSKVSQDWNNRAINLLTDTLHHEELGIPRSYLKQKITIVIILSNALAVQIWSSEDEAEKQIYLKEWKRVVRLYVDYAVKHEVL